MMTATEPESRVAVKQAIAVWLLGLMRREHDSDVVLSLFEIGVKQGMLAEQLLRLDPHLVVTGVDRWAPAPLGSHYAALGDPAALATPVTHHAWHREAAQRLAPFANIRLWAMESAEAAAKVPDATLDAVYLDADHSFPGRLADLWRWVRKVVPGGLVAGGLWSSRYGGDCCERAVRDFLWDNRWNVEVEFGPEHTWAFVKP